MFAKHIDWKSYVKTTPKYMYILFTILRSVTQEKLSAGYRDLPRRGGREETMHFG